MRSISRVADVSINTVSKLLVDAGEACSAYHDEHVRGLATKRVQVDEIWSFTYSKQKNVAAAKAAPDWAGDTWTWTGFDADSKLVISWLVGCSRRITTSSASIKRCACRRRWPLACRVCFGRLRTS